VQFEHPRDHGLGLAVAESYPRHHLAELLDDWLQQFDQPLLPDPTELFDVESVFLGVDLALVVLVHSGDVLAGL
jgi:hypothetical protein